MSSFQVFCRVLKMEAEELFEVVESLAG